jgi:hypothetical protein
MTLCRHFNGIDLFGEDSSHETCNVGGDPVAIAGGRKPGWGLRLPCTRDPVTSCPLREEWSAAELEQQKRDLEKAMAQSSRCVAALPWDSSGPGHSGTVPCPKCGGTIRWARAWSNGHMHAACDTPDCFGMVQ